MESKALTDDRIMESKVLIDNDMMEQMKESLKKYSRAVDTKCRFIRQFGNPQSRLIKIFLGKDIDKAIEKATTEKKTWLTLSKEVVWHGLDTHAVCAKVLIKQLDRNKFALDAEAESAKRNLCEFIYACEQSQVDVESLTQERLEQVNVHIEELPEIGEFLPPCPKLPAQMAEGNLVFGYIAKSYE